MIKHIVMWKLKDEAAGSGKAKNAELIRSKLEDLKRKIPELLEVEVGICMLENNDPSISDVVLCSSFRSETDLKTYAKHPAHLEVVEFIKKVVSERRVVDYTHE